MSMRSAYPAPRRPGRPRRTHGLALVLLMIVFCLGAAAFLWLIGRDALEELHPFQFFADSNTYHRTFRGDTNFEGSLVGVDANYLGPMVMLALAQDNIYIVMLLNVALFSGSVWHISRLLRLDAFVVALGLMLSPITVSSLLSVNKEIFLFPFLALALHARVHRSVLALLMAALCAVLVRWQLLIFFLLVLALAGPLALTRHRGLTIFALLLVLSVAYRLIHPIIEPILSYVEASFESYEGGGSGLFEWSLALQNEGLYFLVFPIKAVHLLFGMGLKLDKIFMPEEIYNDLFIGGHCLVALIVLSWMWARGLLRIQHDLVAVAVVFLAVFCVTPIFAPRYLYFVYVLAILVLAGAPADLGRRKPARRRQVPVDAAGWPAPQIGPRS